MPYKDLQKYKEYQKTYRLRNRERILITQKEWIKRNHNKIKRNQHLWYLEHRKLTPWPFVSEEERLKKKHLGWKKWYIKNKSKKLKDNQKWIEANRIKRRIATNKYYQKNYISGNPYKIGLLLRNRLNMAIHNNQKSGSAVADLGCTIFELKIYLAKQFKEGMNWNNHGLRTWHIDHIKPLSSFDLSNKQEFLKAVHYTNLQPMWWRENIVKGKKI